MHDDITPAPIPVHASSTRSNAEIAQPVRMRMPSLDLLRGIAVLGILLVNIYSFALPEMVRVEPLFLPDYNAREQLLWYLIYFFADGKFIALLSLAFGASLWFFAHDKASLSAAAVCHSWGWALPTLTCCGMVMYWSPMRCLAFSFGAGACGAITG